MLSQTAEYALRAVVYLAQHQEQPQTIHEIAGPTKVPAGYLAKVLQSLARSGLLNSQRGLGGGFTLAQSASELTIYQVVQAVDPISRIHSCPLGRDEHSDKLCALHTRLDEAAALIEKAFKDSSVSEMASLPVAGCILH